MKFRDFAVKYTLPLVFVILVFLLFFYHKNIRKTPVVQVTPAASPSIPNSVERFPGLTKTTISAKKDDGTKDWELSAEKMSMDNITKKITAKNVKFILYDSAGKVYIDFASPLAYGDMNTKSLFFPQKSFGKILSTGEDIEVTKLFWEGARKEARGYNGVKISRSDYTLTGKEMICSPELKRIELIKEVSGIWTGEVPLEK